MSRVRQVAKISYNVAEMGRRQKKKPLVGINAHLLYGEAGYRRAGIHQYIAQVLQHLPPHFAYQFYTRHGLEQTEGVTISSHLPTERRLVRILWEQLVWPWLAWRQQLDLLHGMAFVTPFFAPCPTIVTVFDLSFMHYPERYPKRQQWYLATQAARSCRQARRVITIAKSGRQDVHHFFKVPLTQIDVVYPGVDAVYRPIADDTVAAFRRRENLPKRFILHVGTLQPRKNIPVLLDALAQMGDTTLPLILVGGKGWMFDEIFARVGALGLQDRVRFTGYVPDEDLPLWYNAATLLVFPSVYEGFGLPILEAMACGTAVVAANASSMPEAVGDAGVLFDPHNSVELAERMVSVVADPRQLAKMHERGLEQAKKFSWERAGRETAVVYQQALTI